MHYVLWGLRKKTSAPAYFNTSSAVAEMGSTTDMGRGYAASAKVGAAVPLSVGEGSLVPI